MLEIQPLLYKSRDSATSGYVRKTDGSDSVTLFVMLKECFRTPNPTNLDSRCRGNDKIERTANPLTLTVKL